jgi:hypothetical protein
MSIRLGFGKYKHHQLREVPNDYLEWIKTRWPPSSLLYQGASEELKTRPKIFKQTKQEYVHDWTATEWDSEDWDYEDHEY